MCLASWGVLECRAVAQEKIILDATDAEVVRASVEPTKEEDASDLRAALLSYPDMGETSATAVGLPSATLPKSSWENCKCQKQNLEERFWRLSAQRSDDLDAGDDSEVKQTGESQSDEDNVDGPLNEELGDDELGILRVRSQPVGIDSELGTLRIRSAEDAPLEVDPEPTRQTSVFLTARSNVYGGNNLFRTSIDPRDDRIYQASVGIFAFPRLSDTTNLVLSVEANLARYEDLSVVNYNELQFRGGIRQRLGERSYGQLNWRYQNLSTPGSDSFFTANYVELLLSRRDILNNRTWLDSYYQARLSFSDPKEFSRFTQIATGALNYGFDPQTRVSLLYQLFIDDYTDRSRHDTYHQILAQFSHDLSSTTRISVFGGFRFGQSSETGSINGVDFNDTIYGASINVNLPLF